MPASRGRLCRRRRRAAAVARRARAPPSTTRSTAARTATSCCSISPPSCCTRERLGHAERDRPAVGQLLVERLGRPHLRPGFAAGAGHRDPDRSDDRAAAEPGRQGRRPSAHAGRVHDRPRRRAAARDRCSERGLPGGRMTTKDLFDPIQLALAARFGAGKWLMATAGSSPYLNYELIDKLQLDPAEVRRVAAAAAVKVPHVARVYTRDQLLRGEVAERSDRQPRAARLQRAAVGRPRDHPRAVLDAPGAGHHARHALQLRRAHPADPDGQPHPAPASTRTTSR